MKYNTYLKQLKAVTKLAKEIGLSYTKSYAYKGPKVTRLKFWWLASGKTTQNKFIKQAMRLPYVASVEKMVAYRNFKTGSGFSTPASLKVIFK